MTVADTAEFAGETPVDGLSVPPGAELAAVLESLIPFALGDGELVELAGDGDGDVVAAAMVLGRTASRNPAAIAPPPAMARAPARGRAGIRPR